jgi:dienelactone hydrolase
MGDLMRINRRVVLILALALLFTVSGFVAVLAVVPDTEAMPEAAVALLSDEAVIVDTDPWLTFQPADATPQTGFIIYPGAYVPPEAYAPLARQIADSGYLTVIVPMPLNLAVLAPGRAANVIDTYTNIQTWVIGGHSLGGAMAANFTAGQPDLIDGLVLWAAYPQPSDDLSARDDLVAASIYATRDGIATLDEIDGSRPYLPTDTAFVAIQGGNHAQFGWYGAQDGDLDATISRAEQEAQTAAATLAVLDAVNAD